MPYFIYKIHADKKLEQVGEFEKFREAKLQAREMRAAQTVADNYQVKIIFAKNPSEAKLLLKEEREPQPRGDD